MAFAHQPSRGTPRSPLPSGVMHGLLAIGLATLPFSLANAQDTSADHELAEDRAATFASHFAGVIEPLGPDLRDIDPLVPGDAVDLDTFDPPVERTRVIRSMGTGVASYYGRRFHGRLTANGERFNMRAMTAAHKTLPFGTMVRVTNPSNGRSVVVRINDRGPFIPGREIDLSRGAAEAIGMIQRGHARVELELVRP